MRRTRRSTLLSAAAAALTAAALLPLTAAPAQAATAKADDFNGDGFRDFAYYVASSETSGTSGAVKIVYGAAGGGPGTKTQVVHQNSRGVPGANEDDDRFGAMRASADFNRDGYADLVVSGQGEDVNGVENQGSVIVLWGSATGLSGGTSIPNRAPEEWAWFGNDLAVGDFNGDGKADIAATSFRNTYIYRGSIGRSGVSGSITKLDKPGFDSMSLIAGKVTADSATDLVLLGAQYNSSTERTSSSAWFVRGGSSLTSGSSITFDPFAVYMHEGVIADFDKDGYGDIAIGNSEDSDNRGAVTIWRGGHSGPGSSTRLTQATAGISGGPEAEDLFGDSVSAGDVNGDGYQDLAIGVPGEALGNIAYAGGVHVLKGGSGGLTGSGSAWFDRNTTGVPGTAVLDDNFGKVRLRNTDGDSKADLYINGTSGTVRLPGSSSGITTTGVTEPRIPGAAQSTGLFSEQ